MEFDNHVVKTIRLNLQKNSFKWFFGDGEDDYFQPVCYEIADFFGVVPQIECVYFLFDDAQNLIYIGQTKNFAQRAISHKSEKRILFTHYCVITAEMVGIGSKELKRFEQMAIARHKPPLNRIYYLS